MRHRTIILYTLAWLAYIFFSLLMFPRWNTNVVIPIIAILALGGWLYGTTKGLALIILALFYHYLLLSEIHADINAYYENRVPGTFVSIIVVYLTGTLKNNIDGIKEANARLDQAVLKRTGELTDLTRKLIERAETMRVSRGQELHDGIGQQLTGIQLYSTALAEQLAAEQNTGASLAFSVMSRARATHNLIRQAARSLFPVRAGEISLQPALEELASSLMELKNVDCKLEAEGDLQSASQEAAVQFYRICQETALYILNQADAQHITIKMSASASMLRLAMEHDGEPVASRMKESSEARLIEYRLQQIHGRLESKTSRKKSESLLFEAPKIPGANAA
jgi:glucose-6-phosphate-specific signal transduction histidine kinase